MKVSQSIVSQIARTILDEIPVSTIKPYRKPSESEMKALTKLTLEMGKVLKDVCRDAKCKD